MIYLKDTTNEQRVAASADGRAYKFATLSLALTSTVNRITTVVPCELYGYSPRYAVLQVTLPEGLQVGEYTYTLTADGVEALTGVAQIGDIEREVTAYEKSAYYEQYEQE